MRLVRLGDVCRQSRETVKPGARSDLRYIGLESIESGSGQFAVGELSKTPETPQANSFCFGPEHVLYGKLRPYLNKVVLPDFEGKCSTEIIPLLPSAEAERAYLAFFLRSRHVVDAISAKTAGARMPRADMDFVFSLSVPVPPLTEQRRIVDLLSRAEGIVRLRREAEKKASEIIPALFLDLFGDPATNPKGWPTASIGDLFEIKGGKRLPKGAPYAEEPTAFRYIRGTDIWPDQINTQGLVYLRPEDQMTIKRYVVAKDDVVITIAGKIGVAAPVGDDLVGVNLTENAAMIRPRELARTNAAFLSSILNSGFVQRQIETLTGRVTIGKLALERIRLLDIFLPGLGLQAEYVQRVEQVRSIQSQQSAATAKAQAAFDALLARCFAVPVNQ